MSSSIRRRTTFALAPLLAIALVWGCAQGGLGEATLDIDPTLPEVDAAWAPSPGQKLPEAGKQDASASVDAFTDPEEPVDSGIPESPSPASKPTQGEVLITEVMYDPSGVEPASEWFELYNTTTETRTLSGLTIVDGANRTHVIGAGITIAPGAYVVLVRKDSAAATAKVPQAAIVYEYGANLADGSGIQLANGSTGGLSLRDGSDTIAQADYGGWYTQAGGSSLQLKTLTYAAAQQSSSWCLSTSPWTTGSDKGTPGAASDCP
jgi:hypothetical protein